MGARSSKRDVVIHYDEAHLALQCTDTAPDPDPPRAGSLWSRRTSRSPPVRLGTAGTVAGPRALRRPASSKAVGSDVGNHEVHELAERVLGAVGRVRVGHDERVLLGRVALGLVAHG